MIPLLFCFALVFALPIIVRRMKAADLVFFSTIAIVYFIDYFLFPDNQGYLFSNAFRFLGTCVTLFFVGICLDVPQVSKKLYIASLISMWVNLVYFIFVRRTSYKAVAYGDMDAAYHLLPHICWIACNMFERPHAFNIISFAVGSFLLFSMGSRGPMLCLLALIVLYLVFFKKFKHPLRANTIILIVAIILVLTFFPIVKWLTEVSKDIGLSTRVFERISENTFFVSGGRDDIRNSLMTNLAERPAIGFGIGGDRALLGRYAHNIWLELCVSFGYPLGTLLVIVLAVVLLRGIIKGSPGEERAFVLTLICSSVLKLMMSGSFLDEEGLYLLIGLCISIARKAKKERTQRLPASRISDNSTFNEIMPDKEALSFKHYP